MEFTRRLNALLMNLWGRKCSPHPTPPPSWLLPRYLYIFEINYLSVVSLAIIFSHSEGCLFTLIIVSIVMQKFLILVMSHLFIFAFISNILGDGSKRTLSDGEIYHVHGSEESI